VHQSARRAHLDGSMTLRAQAGAGASRKP
jgi:hypothetical protein